MAHPEIDNRTPFEVEPLFIADEDGRPIVAPIIKATFDVDPRGHVELAEEQRPVDFEGTYWGEPGESSIRLEPETAFVKPSTDVVLLGYAYAPASGTTWVDVQFQVGPLNKWVRVHGDRHVLGDGSMSAPKPFEMMPLTYERAFGGWDRTSENPDDHSCEPWNPVGVGFKTSKGQTYVGEPLPNIEDPNDPLRRVGGWCRPTGLGFVAPHWQPRVSYAGTYDEAWTTDRAPLLPTDFDRRFFQAASESLVTPTYLNGDEAVLVRQATPEGQWAFALPGVSNPVCRIATKHGEDRALDADLDTVIVDAEARQLIMLWRCHAGLRDGPLDVRSITVVCDHLPFAAGTTSAVAHAGTPAT